MDLVDADVNGLGQIPFDMYARDGYMHVVMAGTIDINTFEIEDDGTLTFVSAVGGLSSAPAAAVGFSVNQGLAL